MVDYTALCVTSELRALMKPTRGKLVLLPDHENICDEWYADLCSIERRHCVLFMHGTTHYSVMVVAQSSDSIRQLRKMFISAITSQLNAERIASEKQQHILATWQAIAYRSATDKRLISALNDRLRDYRLLIDKAGGVLRCDVGLVNNLINRQTTLFRPTVPAQLFANRFVVELAGVAASPLADEYATIKPQP